MLLYLVQIKADTLKLKKYQYRTLSNGFETRNYYVCLYYDIIRELKIPPLSSICGISQIICFIKRKKLIMYY